eukprot:COSAG01_NODE_7965_length_2973_cov_162.993389_3_plen_105_part_00
MSENSTRIEGEFEYVTQGGFIFAAVIAAGITHKVQWLRAAPRRTWRGLACSAPGLLQVHRGWLQESMVYIVFGAVVGGLVLLVEGGREQDVGQVRTHARTHASN